MIEEMKKYPVDFAVLLIGLAAAFFFLAQLAYFPEMQAKVLAATAVFYFFWGVAHHLLRGSFSLKLAVEYASFSLLGLVFSLAILHLF